MSMLDVPQPEATTTTTTIPPLRTVVLLLPLLQLSLPAVLLQPSKRAL
jgi:hypothetical protein